MGEDGVRLRDSKPRDVCRAYGASEISSVGIARRSRMVIASEST